MIMTTMAVALMLTAIVACYQQTAYFNYQSTAIDGWHKSDVLQFAVPSVDEEGYYVEEVGVRVNAEYPYRQLALVVNQEIISTRPKKNVCFKTDTLVLDIYDEEGRAIGKGVNLRQYVIAVRQLSLKAGDSLSVSIKHHMQQSSISGVADVGIKVTHAE